MVRRNRMLNGFSSLLYLGILLLCKPVQAALPSNTYLEIAESSDFLQTGQYVKVKNGKLYIGAKFDAENDILISFEKCMFNELMTFSKVGLAENLNPFPADNPDRKVLQLFNEATSDNVGPVMLMNGGWVGGNHSFKEDGRIKTAATVSFRFYADGELLQDGDTRKAEKVSVIVKNELYDPFQPMKGNDGTVLSLGEVLLEEEVVYTIQKGQIYLEVSHLYKNTKEYMVDRYYGMQSMFVGETELMTPKAIYFDFRPDPQELSLLKNDYSLFNRFIERNTVSGICQSTYLMSFPDRDPYWALAANDKIFVRAHNKSYHNQFSKRPVRKGAFFKWAGLYTWFVPLIDDRKVLTYTGVKGNETFLFIDCKQQGYFALPLPEEMFGKKYRVVEQSEGISYVQEDAIIKVTADHAGTIVLAYY